jgi:hypothetical protein
MAGVRCARQANRREERVAEPIRELLDFIVVQYAVQDEQIDIDLNANAAEEGEEIASEKQAAAQREMARADELSDAFNQGLLSAYRAYQAGEKELVLDDRDPEENRMADALIGFLVSFELAESRSEETEPMHYRYTITVDWDRLRQVAADAGVDLDRALAV